MPIYDLFCEKCKTKVELITKVDKKERCRKCGNEMKRLPTQANFILKGHCWSTDNYSGRDE